MVLDMILRRRGSDLRDFFLLVPLILSAVSALATSAFAAAADSSGPHAPSFLWGFCQAYDGRRGEVFPLTREELTRLRDELHINALRFWVHPAWVGLPQKTFNGPESIDYCKFAETDYVWRDPSPPLDSLDELLDVLYALKIHPVLMVWPVNEYVQYVSRDDLTFLNDAQRSLDYKGIRPVDEIKALSVALARHVHGQYGDDFSLIYTELAGGNDLGAPRRPAEKGAWLEIRQAIKSVAPAATVYSPELCISMWWWGAARPAFESTGRNAPPVNVAYTESWPPGDRLENYRDAFDRPAISYFGLSPTSIERTDVAADRTLLQAATDATLWTGRANFRPQPWHLTINTDGDQGVVIDHIRPGVLYLLKVEP